jgi:hypothetical protein
MFTSSAQGSTPGVPGAHTASLAPEQADSISEIFADGLGNGVGGILGALGAGHLHPARPLVVALALAPLGAFVYLALALVAPFPLIAAASSLSGGVFGVFEVLWETTLQRSVAREALSRVSSLDWLGSTATNPLGQGLAGITAGAFSVEDVLLVGTVAMLLIPLLGLGSRSVRAAQKEHGGRPARDETPPLPDAS